MAISVYTNSEQFLNVDTLCFNSYSFPGFNRQGLPTFATAPFCSENLWISQYSTYAYSDWQKQPTVGVPNKSFPDQNIFFKDLDDKYVTCSSVENQERYSFDSRNKPAIWRPFSPASSSQNDTFVESIISKQNNRISERAIFHSIKPSNVKIGTSKTSVFKAVKKNSKICVSSSFRSLSNRQLNNRMKVQTRSKPFRCEYPNCYKSFARNEELTRHKRIHSGFKPHQCGTCKKRFGRKDHLSKHLKTHLQTSEKKIYQCTFPGCGHRYTRSDALTRHKSTAHAIKRPQKWNNKSNLADL